MSTTAVATRRSTKSKASPRPKSLAIGDEIDFGDPGVGRITARDVDRVFLESPVFTGWVTEDYLLGTLWLNPDA